MAFREVNRGRERRVRDEVDKEKQGRYREGEGKGVTHLKLGVNRAR